MICNYDNKMTKLEFKQLEFKDNNGSIRVNFLKIFYFDINKEDLMKIGNFEIDKNSITFSTTSQRAQRKFDFLINKGFLNMKNKISKRNTFYIHKFSNTPILGSIYLGIVDKGSSMLELKPLTSCNMNCIFCSVDEGITSKRLNEYLIQREYLVEETDKLLKYKKEHIDIYINPHGEPLLYPELAELCQDLSNLQYVNSITLITAGTLLSKSLIDKLKDSNTKLNVSLHALDHPLAKKLFGTKGYNLNHVLDMLRYASNKLDIIIAPVLLPNYNEAEIPKIIEFAKEIKAKISVQKFLINKQGRNPVKEESWVSFNNKLKEIERKGNCKLIEELQQLKKSKELPKPFKSKQVISAKIVLPGRFNNEVLATSKDRLISIHNCEYINNKEIKIRILKSKYGLFKGELV